MQQFVNSFCITLLHSFWQAALLWLFTAFNIGKIKASASVKKKLYLLALAFQAVFSIVTFFYYFLGIDNSNSIFLIEPNWLSDISIQNNLVFIYRILFSLYIIIFGYKIVKLLWVWKQTKKQLFSSLQQPLIDVKLFTKEKANELGIRKKVDIWFSDLVESPIAFGWLKPIILLPISITTNLSVQQTEALILHELAHIKANDYIINWLIVFCETVFFFNPFIKKICSQIKLQRELQCDETVLNFKYSPIVYAEALLQIGKNRIHQPVMALAATNKQQQLLQRVQYFTDITNFAFRNKRFIAFNLLKGLFAISLIFILVRIEFKKLNSLPFSNTSLITTANLNYENKNSVEVKKVFTISNKIKPEEKATKNTNTKKGKLKNPTPSFVESESNLTAMPVSLEETPTQQIFITEEKSGSTESSIQIYNAKYVNGKWIIEPQIKVDKKPILIDSTNPKN